jgi:4-hydroxy-tetrahydrodipicolinate synthase
MHNRMKEALVLLGRIPCAAVRPPLVKLTDAELARIQAALAKRKSRARARCCWPLE